ncbi:MAG: hypothetical protein ABH811_00115 [archaeon]
MAKKKGLNLLSFVAWLTGVIVSLSVGFAMINKTLSLPGYLGGATVAVVAGWIVVITTAISVILAVVNYFK